MRKVRVYQLARELKVSNQVVIDFLAEIGNPVQNHASSVDSTIADQVRSSLAGPKRMTAKSKEAAAAVQAKKPEGKSTAGTVTKPRTLKTAPPVRKIKPTAEPASIWGKSGLPQVPAIGQLDLSRIKPVSTSMPPARYMGPRLAMVEVIRPVETPKETRRPKRDGRGGTQPRKQVLHLLPERASGQHLRVDALQIVSRFEARVNGRKSAMKPMSARCLTVYGGQLHRWMQAERVRNARFARKTALRSRSW